MTVKIALIGAGYWGKNLLRNFHNLGALKTVCEVSSPVREARSKEYPGLHFTGSLDETLADPEIAAVAIASPAPLHFEIAKKAFLAGKHVFVEKPITLDIKHAEELVRLGAERKLVLMVGHILQYHPAVLKAKELIDSGELGTPRYIYSHRLNFGKTRKEENVLWSFAPHDISVMLMLAGQFPDRISGSGEAFLQKGIEDFYRVDVSFPSGLKGHIFVSWYNPFKEQKLVVVAEKKMLVFDDTSKENKLMMYPAEFDAKNGFPEAMKTAGIPVLIDASEPLKNECGHFLDCVASGRRPRTDGEEGLRVLRFLHAAGHQ